ncbi:DUF6475 domain-containing protein [uncultured Paraglaciecola sp.]|uniref:DUF6475 domain-containing protein n=1 Tax=uncultured Paraglaciecola sp. TaxID=1765024 RepID=UPI0026113D8D|nr:DUF6475 domain-containing protein [uncultured Paraglaciecola sp.]
MKQEHFNEFCSLLDNVAEQYSKTLSQSLKSLYWQGLHDVEFEAVRDALFRHIRNTDKDGDFMPKISNIRKMIEGSSEDSSLSAWTKIDKALRSVGTYKSVVFDDPLIHKVIQDMGGWIAFGTKTEDEWPFVANEFQKRYRGFKSRSMEPEYPSHLIGMAESNNSKEGYRIDPPRLIGNQEKANQVMNSGIGLIEFNNSIGLKPMKNDVEKAVGSMCMLDKNEASA